MKLKRVVVLLIVLFLPIFASAENSITGTELKKYKEGTDSDSRVEIKNIDTNNEYVLGSKFQIWDENGFVEFEFESTNDSYVIEGLDAGVYYLVQIDASEKYIFNSNKIKFEVKDEVLKIEFKNEIKKTSNTDVSPIGILIVLIGMVNVSLLVGISVYVKKRKAK